MAKHKRSYVYTLYSWLFFLAIFLLDSSCPCSKVVLISFLDEGTTKETYEEDKGERLEFEDEPEYEEEAAVDYDEKDLEQYEEQYEDGDEVVEYTEDVIEEETDMVDEELDGGDDGEGEGYENAEEEHNVDVEDEEHHEMVKEHRKRKEFEVFVGGLDKDATESDLRKVFGEVGEITEVRLMMNPVTKKNKGFAFLRYATVEQARRAVSELKNPSVGLKIWIFYIMVCYYYK